MFDETETLVPRQMTNVRGVTGDQIVNGNNAVTFRQKSIHQVRAEKTRPASDDGNRLGMDRHIWVYLAIDLKIASTKHFKM